MFRTDVPIILKRVNPQIDAPVMLSNLRALHADRVFMAVIDLEDLAFQCDLAKQLADYFRENGIEPAIWIGGSLMHMPYDREFGKMVNISGQEVSIMTCPTDERFVEYFCSVMEAFAKTGVKLIQIDDDFRMQMNGQQPLCFCPEHMKLYSQALGEGVTQEAMRKNLLTGKPNRYRKAWLDVNNDLLLRFAKRIRQAVDKVDPSIVLSACTGPGNLGSGMEPVQTWTHLFAGNGQSYLRLSAGPYWEDGLRGLFNLGLANIIDFSRLQAQLHKGSGITVVGEADSYPRPRYAVSAASMELFELALRADGNHDGILKYAIDYVAPPTYEMGYIRATQKNQDLYRQVHGGFDGKTATGFSVFDPLTILADLDGAPETEHFDLEARVVRVSAIHMLNDNTIPSHFAPAGPTVVFGEVAKRFDLNRVGDGLVLDLTAAKILMERGVDVGIRSIGKEFTMEDSGSPLVHVSPYLEHFAEGQWVQLGLPEVYRLDLDEKAEVLTYYTHGPGDCPGVYRYENAQKQRFVVYPFDAFKNQGKMGVFRNYNRQKELADAYQWLSGKPLDAVCFGHPDLYIMTKRNEEGLAVGLWNFSRDAIDEPVLELGDMFKEVEGINCTASLNGKQVVLSKLGAFEFAAVVLK